jgi:uncharacterized protein with GYD domain
MPKFLWQVSYTAQGAKGLLSENATSRRATVEALIEGLGGSVESWHYAFGKYDLVIVADLPSNTAAAALSLVVGASGAARITTTSLFSQAEMDEASTLAVPYRAPGA